MKRDMDLIRNILLQIEEKDLADGRWIELSLDHYGHRVVTEHLFLLAEDGLIQGNDVSTMQGRAYRARRLTSRGHDFLNSVRDPVVWQKTKDGAKAAGGFTIELLGELAKGFIKTEIKKRTGIEV